MTFLNHKELVARPSPRKLEILKDLSSSGLRLSDGYDYNLYDHILPQSSLEKTRERLSAIKESLSREIVEERQR